MKLLEHQAKDLLSNYGIPTPQGGLATSIEEASNVAKRLNPPFVVKAQIPIAGRGKAGGILFANSITEVEKTTQKILNMRIQDIPVNRVLVEEQVSIKKELYFGITIDRVNRSYVAIASAAGGIEIEEIAEKSQEKILKELIYPPKFYAFHARQMARKIGYGGRHIVELGNIFVNLYHVCMDYDAELIETNPLVETFEGKFIAVDARIIIDDSALFRHREYEKRCLIGKMRLTPPEREAIKNDLAYVKMDGNIGTIGNGAGLVMATLDLIKYYGGEPANFLDVGGGASAEKISKAIEVVLSDENVRALFINILGGITRCDEVARGIVEVQGKGEMAKPIVVRLIGTNEIEGIKILTDAGFDVFESMEEAAQQVVELSRRGDK